MTDEEAALDGRHVHVLEGLEPGTSYHYRLVVRDWSGNETVSEDMTFSTPALEAPEALRGFVSGGQAQLSWNPVFGASSYRIERGETADGPFEEVATTQETSYSETGLEDEASYYYVVSALGQEGSEAASAPVQTTAQPDFGEVLAGAGESAVAVPRTDAISVDGDLTDWPMWAPIEIDHTMTADATDVTDDADLSAVAQFAWDDDKLYVAIEVSDDVLVFERSGGDIWQNDAVEIWLGGQQFGVALADGETYVHSWGGMDTAQIEAALVTHDSGYTVEVAFPLELVEEATGTTSEAEATFPVAVGVNDADEPGGERVGQIYFPEGWVWGDPETFGTAVLVR
jgi:hypothetical protein